jgi:N-acetylmuramoyl-L-alanine amidase
MISNQLTSANIFHTDIYPSLESLVLDDNYIHGIYDLPNNTPNLKYLSLNVNSIHRLDTLSEFQHLEYLNISRNQITFLDAIPASLKSLNASHCKIRMLQSRLGPHVEKINLACNSLKFAGLPFHWGMSLRELNLSFNKIHKFPKKLPDTLEVLYIQGNLFVDLPDTLPTSLRILVASDNKIMAIPPYTRDNRLELLVLSENKLTDLSKAKELSKVFVGEHNWNKSVHHTVADRLKKLWRRYCLQLRLRSIVRTQRIRTDLLETSMSPSRLGKFEPIPKGWYDS